MHSLKHATILSLTLFMAAGCSSKEDASSHVYKTNEDAVIDNSKMPVMAGAADSDTLLKLNNGEEVTILNDPGGKENRVVTIKLKNKNGVYAGPIEVNALFVRPR